MIYTNQRRHLAWHETLDMHELVAFQANALMMLKQNIRRIRDTALRDLYRFSIQSLEHNLRDLLRFYPAAPRPSISQLDVNLTPFFAGNLLGIAKTAVRSYAIAITETATPALRDVLTRQLNHLIQLHARVFEYMYTRGYYPSYDLTRLLATDQMNATRAIQMRY